MRISRTLTGTIITIAAVLALGACTPAPKTVEVPRASLPSTVPSGGPSIYTPGASGQPAEGDPIDTGPAGISSPSAAMEGTVDGEAMSLSFATVVGYPIYNGPDNLASISWVDEQGNSLSMGTNHLSKGTKKTGVDGLSLQFVLNGPTVTDFTSGDGSCTVTITDAEAHLIAGRFDCTDVESSSGSKLSAQGSFRSRMNVGVEPLPHSGDKEIKNQGRE